MPLLGKGVMAFWNDITAEGEADFNHWHVHEHMPERVGVPGFLRGRRYRAIAGAPKYFNFYETASLATLTGKAYLDRLNDPTPWSRRSLANFRNSNRTLCTVVASYGLGQGQVMTTVRFAAEPAAADGLRRALTDELLPPLVERPGVVGAHLLQGDPTASATETSEKSLRDRPDEVADGVLLLETADEAALSALRQEALSDKDLADRGARDLDVGIYRLLYSLDETELALGRAVR